jgi:hypothetical protein
MMSAHLLLEHAGSIGCDQSRRVVLKVEGHILALREHPHAVHDDPVAHLQRMHRPARTGGRRAAGLFGE